MGIKEATSHPHPHAYYAPRAFSKSNKAMAVRRCEACSDAPGARSQPGY